MNRPDQASGYRNGVAEDRERVSVTPLRGLGPWQDSVYPGCGLTPRHPTKARPPQVPPHAGTSDVGTVAEPQMHADTEADHSLEENVRKLGSGRGENAKGESVPWRWQAKVEGGATVIPKLPANDPEPSDGKVQPLPPEGNVPALEIPHPSMVLDHHEAKETGAALPGAVAVATETIRHADMVSCTCLKPYSLDHQHERRDTHDPVQCLEHRGGGLEATAAAFGAAREGKHRKSVEAALKILATRFADDEEIDSYVEDGPVAVAKFELGDDVETRVARMLRQCGSAGPSCFCCGNSGHELFRRSGTGRAASRI